MFKGISTSKRAADFSFLMLLPVVLGATLIQGLEVAEQGAVAGYESVR